MARLENGDSDKQIADNITQGKVNLCEDEINLIDYFLVLWKRKWFILLATLLPTLVIGITLFIYPRTYKATYVYDVRGDAGGDVRGDAGGDVRGDVRGDVKGDAGGDVKGDVRGDVRGDVSSWNLNEKNFDVLQSRFYSEENLNKIIDELQKNKLDKYARQVRNFKAETSEKFVKFEVSPSFVDLSKLKVTNPNQFERLRNMKAFLLNMTITGKPFDDLGKIALIIRDNFEEVMPLYMIQEQLSTDIRGYNSKLANFESSRFGLGLDLKNNTEILAGLKKIDITTSDEKGGEVVLRFDVVGQSQYLPLSYQIQAVELKIVKLRGKLKADTASYKYYKDLLDLNARMVTELNGKLASDNDYTIKLFRLFLTDLIGEIEKQELRDYLASYIKKIENRISVSVPVSENPKIYPIAKATVKKSAIVSVIAFAISVLLSFILEVRRNRKNQIQTS